MAALTGVYVFPMFYTQACADRICLFAIRDGSTGDTADLGPSGQAMFLTVTLAVIVTIKGNVQLPCAVSGTVVTMPAGMTNDFGYLLAYGAASS